MPTTLIPLTKGCTLGRIDHNMPRAMKNPMDKNKWIKFCDGVDAILMPTKIMIWFRLLVFVASVVLLGLSISKLQPLQHKNLSHWKHTNTYEHNSGFIWLIIAAGIMLVLAIIISFVIRYLTSTTLKKLEDLCDRNSGKGVDFYVKDKYHNHRIRKQISKLCVEVSTATTVVSIDIGSNDSDIEEVLEVVEGQYDDSYDIEEVEVLEEEQEEEQSDDSYGSYDDESPEPSQSNDPTSTTTSTSPLPHQTQASVLLVTAYAVKEQDTFNNQAASPSVTTYNARKWDRREQQKLAQSRTEMGDVDEVGDFVGDIVVEPIIVNRNWDIREQRKLTESRINDDNKNDTMQDLTIGKVDIVGDVVINIDNESVVSAMP